MPAQPRSRLLERIYHHQHDLVPTFVPHYDRVFGDLVGWRWPVSEAGHRITPTSLSDYRTTHNFKYPCCLCATDRFEPDYTESAIYLPVFGPYSGKYVAGCVTNSCGYLVDIERMYSTLGLLVRKYQKRAATVPPPPPVIYMPTIGQRGTPNLYATLPFHEPPNRASESSLDQLLRLDSVARPGLSEMEFRKLFCKCRCGKVTTRRVFKEHVCLIAEEPPIVIDLTHSDDSVVDLTSDD